MIEIGSFSPGDLLLLEKDVFSYAVWPNYESLQGVYADYDVDAIFGLTTTWTTIDENRIGVYLGFMSHPRGGGKIHIIWTDGEPKLVHFLNGVSVLEKYSDRSKQVQ